MKAIKISTDETIKVVEIDSGPTSMDRLTCLQDQVGGLIEFLDVDGKLAAIINEEGKLKGLPYNLLGTMFAHQYCGLFSQDSIVGDMLLVGTNEEGDTIDVPETAMVLVRD